MSNFWGIFYVLGGKKNNFKKIYCSVRTEKLHKMKLKKTYFFSSKFKLELSPQNIHNEPLLCILFGYNQSARGMGVWTG